MIFPQMLTIFLSSLLFNKVDFSGGVRQQLKVVQIFVNKGWSIFFDQKDLILICFDIETQIYKYDYNMNIRELANDPLTQNTEPESPRSSTSQNSSSIKNSPTIEKILASTQQIINEQAKKIFQLTVELNERKKQNTKLQNKYNNLLEAFQNQKQQKSQIQYLLNKINSLETDLASTKIELALSKENILEKKYQNIRDMRQQKIVTPNKNNIEQIFTVSRLKDNINFIKKKLAQQSEKSDAKEHWKKYITNHGNSSLHKGSKFKEKTNQLVKGYIPHSLRETVWPIIFQNYLGITNSLYIELLQRMGKTPSGKVKIQIEKDINRSFYGKTEFDSKTGLTEEVSQILEIFHLYRPDVSYVQGMTYPVIVLDLVVGKIKAFTIFSNLVLSNKFFRRLFMFQGNFVNVYCRTFDVLLTEYFPKISFSLNEKKIQSEIYLVQWFFTFFSRGLTYESTLKIWDLLAYHHELLFYRLGLVIMELLEKQIILTPYQTVIPLIREYSEHINEQSIFPLLLNHKLTYDKLQKTIDKIIKQMKN